MTEPSAETGAALSSHAASGVNGKTTMRAVGTHVLVFTAYVVASIGMTWPLARRMSDHVLAAKWHHDAYTNAMILATRVLNAMGEGAGGVYENFFFAPIPQTIVFNENLFGLSLLYAPFYLASGNPLLAYNQVLILSLALSGYGAYLLVAHLTGSRLAAFLSGLAFAFCPYATFEIGRIQLVATAWIPLSLLCLHLAVERGRGRYSFLFALCYAMQVGTCLYYAMFMLPLLAVLLLWLTLRRRRFELRFWGLTALAGVLCAGLLVAMIKPYFATRDDFALKRSETFARSYDGELSFLGNVHLDNRLWKPLRHASKDLGAHEEIAFPTATMSLLALFALAMPLLRALRRRGQALDDDRSARASMRAVLLILLVIAAAIGASILFRTTIVGVLVLGGGVAYVGWSEAEVRLPTGDIALYAVLLLLSLVLFLGLEPIDVDGASVKGLYYYLHTYVPGFNGIRKVSRQAIVVMMMVAIVGGFGAAALFKRWPSRRAWLSAAMGAMLMTEVACVPMRLSAVPAGKTVPSAYDWLAKHNDGHPIALLPTNTGQRRFRGNPGLAMHNYLTVYHRRRTINGKSSWIPPVTHLFHRVTRNFPTPESKRLLQLLGVRDVVIHTSDMPPGVGSKMIAALNRSPDEYKRVYRDGPDYIYRIAPSAQKLELLETPPLTTGLQQVHRWNIKATASREQRDLPLAFDDRALTRWTTGGAQVPGDYLELRLPRAQKIAAIELMTPEAAFELPAAYEVTVADGDEALPQVVFTQDELQVHRDQVLRPRSFVFRVVLPKPTHADRIRVTVLQAFPDTPWSVQEAVVWTRP